MGCTMGAQARLRCDLITLFAVPASGSLPPMADQRLRASLIVHSVTAAGYIGAVPTRGGGLGQAGPPTLRQPPGSLPPLPPTHLPRPGLSAHPSSTDQFLLTMGPWLVAPSPDRPGRQQAPQDHQA